MNQVISQIGDLITQIGVSKSQLVQGMSDSNIDSASRVSWKVRSVVPSYYIQYIARYIEVQIIRIILMYKSDLVQLSLHNEIVLIIRMQ
jgi:hypothetical protein